MSRSRPRNIWSGNHRPCKSLVEFLDFDFKKHNMARSHEKMHLKSIQQATFWSYILFYIYIFMCCIYTSTIFPVFVINDQDYSFYTQSFPMTLKTSSSTRFALVSSIQKPEPLRFFPTALHDPLKKEKHTTWNIHDHVNPQLAPFRRHVYVSTITKKNTCINVDIELFNVYIRLSPVTQCQWRQKNQKGRMMNNEQLHIWLQRVSRCRTRVCSTIITNHFVYK